MAKTLLRRILSELRTERPNDSVVDLLRLANYIIAAHRQPEFGDFSDYIGRPHFAAMAVDHAINDGGWKVLEFERRAGMFRDE